MKDLEEKKGAWLASHPDASVDDAFRAGWLACTEAWCHGKREMMEQVIAMMREILL